jgi:hypothetical protein
MEAKRSKASWWFRRALRFRSQRWRRRQVVFWSVLIGFWWLASIGIEHRGFRGVLHTLYPLMLGVPLGVNWRRQRTPVVTSLEDRAQLEYGRSFDALREDEKKVILDLYQVGTYIVMQQQEDEREQMDRMKSQDVAARILRTTMLIVLAAYWVGYLWLPSRPGAEMDPRGWLDPLAWITGMVTLVFVLPNAVWMWREPDAVSELTVMTMQGQEA